MVNQSSGCFSLGFWYGHFWKAFMDFLSYYATVVLQNSPAQQVPEQTSHFYYYNHHLLGTNYVLGLW